MAEYRLYGKPNCSLFDLVGNKEPDQTKGLGLLLSESTEAMKSFLHVLGKNFHAENECIVDCELRQARGNNLSYRADIVIRFYDNFIKSKEIAENGIGEFAFTLNEVKKYISLRTSLPEIDKTFFMTIIFQHHFTQGENILKAQKLLNLDSFFFIPSITYTESYLKFSASSSSKNNKIKVKIYKPKSEERELIDKFNSMTSSEKLCFLFLYIATLSDA